MKFKPNYIIVFILSIFIFTACSQKRVIEVNYGDKPIIKSEVKKQEAQEPIVEEKEENVTVLEESKIQEDLLYKDKKEKFYLAVVYSSKHVSNYYESTLSTILGYLNYRKADFNIKGFDCKDETVEALNSCLNNVYNSGFNNVIALFTPFVANNLATLNTYDLNVYLPLLEKQSDTRFIYGSIDYEAQIKKMMEYAYMNTTIIYQDNFLGNKLYDTHNKVNPSVDYVMKIDNSNNDYKSLIENKEVLNYSTVFMYTNNIKASLLLSQMTVYEKYPSLILSTQQNFKPDIFELTQKHDRKNLLIASSISDFNGVLKDEIEYFGADATYNWVDYSVLVGVNYFYDKNLYNLLKNEIVDNQVIYETKVYEAKKFGFVELK